MAEIAFELKGLTPLVMHNGQMADPDNEFAQRLKALTKKRNKSPEERAEVSRTEWQGSLYFHEKLGPVLTDQNLLACLVQGAKVNRQGKEIDALVSVSEPFYRLEYDGPRDPEKMWKAGMFDRRVVSSSGKPGGPKIVRTRPLFKTWSVKFGLYVDEELDPNDVVQAMTIAGKRVGLCERTKFRWGRFEVVKSEIKK